jgi:dynamin GTPase
MADKLGTPYLQKVLNEQLKNHIKEKLPSLRDKLQAQYQSLEKEVADYKHLRPDDVSMKTKAMLQSIQGIQQDFDRAIEGSREGSLNTSELSGGAKINRIFHERFPYEIKKVEFDVLTQQQEIAMAIQNIRGVRVGLFTPDKAFETIAKQEIDKLREPSMKCIDLVVQEIISTIRNCTKKIGRYPLLMEATERIITTYVREKESECRDQVNLIMNCELAYMNTNHEDLLKYANNQSNPGEPGRKLGNEVIRKGYLSIQTQSLGIMRVGWDCWFVLTSESLSWFKDNKEDEKIFTLTLHGLKLKDVETSFRHRRHTFSIFHPKGKNVYKDWKTLELSGESEDDVESWKASLLRASVLPEKTSGDFKTHVEDGESHHEKGTVSIDPQLKRQVDIIQNGISSYMKIVTKTCLDLVPKTIMLILMNNAKTFISGELLAHLYATGNTQEMMEESADELVKREEMLRLYYACQDAIKIIGDVSVAATTSKRISNSSLDNLDNLSSLQRRSPSPFSMQNNSSNNPRLQPTRPAPAVNPYRKSYQNPFS